MGFVSSGAPFPKHARGHAHTHTSCAVLGRVAQKRGLGSRLKAASWLPLPPSLHHHARREARMRSPVDGQDLPPLLPHYLSHLPLPSMVTDNNSSNYHLPSVN